MMSIICEQKEAMKTAGGASEVQSNARSLHTLARYSYHFIREECWKVLYSNDQRWWQVLERDVATCEISRITRQKRGTAIIVVWFQTRTKLSLSTDKQTDTATKKNDAFAMTDSLTMASLRRSGRDRRPIERLTAENTSGFVSVKNLGENVEEKRASTSIGSPAEQESQAAAKDISVVPQSNKKRRLSNKNDDTTPSFIVSHQDEQQESTTACTPSLVAISRQVRVTIKPFDLVPTDTTPLIATLPTPISSNKKMVRVSLTPCTAVSENLVASSSLVASLPPSVPSATPMADTLGLEAKDSISMEKPPVISVLPSKLPPTKSKKKKGRTNRREETPSVASLPPSFPATPRADTPGLEATDSASLKEVPPTMPIGILPPDAPAKRNKRKKRRKKAPTPASALATPSSKKKKRRKKNQPVRASVTTATPGTPFAGTPLVGSLVPPATPKTPGFLTPNTSSCLFQTPRSTSTFSSLTPRSESSLFTLTRDFYNLVVVSTVLSRVLLLMNSYFI